MSDSDKSIISECKYTEEDVGKHFKNTKKKYTWEFKFNENTHKIILYDSRISGKKEIQANGRILFPKQL
jgi:hypothetical protein